MAIESRLPTVGDVDIIEVDYETTTIAPEAALCCALLARLNHAIIPERRAALVGLARLIRRPGVACADAVAMAAAHAPASVLTALLTLIEEYEPAPYNTTVASVHALTSVASGARVVARVLARSILERIGIEVPLPQSATMPLGSSMPDQRVRQLAGYFGRGDDSILLMQSGTGSRSWPPKVLRSAIASDDLKNGTQRLRRRMNGNRVGRRPELWWPMDEEQEEILQRVGASARAHSAAAGDIDPTVEQRVARDSYRRTSGGASGG